MKTRSHKKSQIEFGIVSFIVVIIALLLFAPIMLKIFNAILTPIQSQVGNITASAGVSVGKVKDTFITFWDWVLLMAYLISVVLLLISAFLIDTHPVFLVIFFVFGIFTFIFAPMLLDVVDQIYEDPRFSTMEDGMIVTSEIPMMDFIRQYFVIMMLGIYFICGIIIYAKVAYFGARR